MATSNDDIISATIILFNDTDIFHKFQRLFFPNSMIQVEISEFFRIHRITLYINTKYEVRYLFSYSIMSIQQHINCEWCVKDFK